MEQCNAEALHMISLYTYAGARGYTQYLITTHPNGSGGHEMKSNQ